MMAKREKQPAHKVVMTEGKRQIQTMPVMAIRKKQSIQATVP